MTAKIIQFPKRGKFVNNFVETCTIVSIAPSTKHMVDITGYYHQAAIDSKKK